MAVLIHESEVAATLEAVFAFHADVRNLRRVQPPGFKARVEGLPERVEAGAEFEVVAGAFGLPQRWRVKIVELVPPRGQPARARLEDVALSGPFPFFHHRHEFEEMGGRVRVRDVVDFDPPGGRVSWLLLPAVWGVMKVMFWHRHRVMRRIFEVP